MASDPRFASARPTGGLRAGPSTSTSSSARSTRRSPWRARGSPPSPGRARGPRRPRSTLAQPPTAASRYPNPDQADASGRATRRRTYGPAAAACVSSRPASRRRRHHRRRPLPRRAGCRTAVRESSAAAIRVVRAPTSGSTPRRRRRANITADAIGTDGSVRVGKLVGRALEVNTRGDFVVGLIRRASA